MFSIHQDFVSPWAGERGVKGDEPPIPGYTEKDAIDWCIESIKACIPAVEKVGEA
jgi:hypothetical protein